MTAPAFEARFAEACANLLGNLTAEQRAEVELLASSELAPLVSAVTFPDRVEVRAAGLKVGAISVHWLQTGDGDPIVAETS